MLAYPLDDTLELALADARHAPALFAVVDANRAYLRQWHPWVDRTKSAADSRTALKTMEAGFHEGNQLQTVLFENARLIGMIGMNSIDTQNRYATLGYWLSADAQGRGIVTRAARALIGHAFDTLELNRVEIRCGVTNTRSRAVAERLGFTFDGVIRDREWLYDRFIDHAIYGLKTPRQV